MPIYEFECRDCHRKITALVMSRERIGDVRCKKCGGANLEKLWSRFASPKSEEARLDALADPSSIAGLDENDPASVARWMRKMGKEMGEDLGDDFDAAVEEDMAGTGGPEPDGGAGSGGSDDL